MHSESSTRVRLPLKTPRRHFYKVRIAPRGSSPGMLWADVTVFATSVNAAMLKAFEYFPKHAWKILDVNLRD